MKNIICIFIALLIAANSSLFAQCTQTLNPGDNVATAITNAAAGSTICLNSGSYSLVTLINVTKTSDVTIQSASGRGATISFDFYGTTHLKLQNLTITSLAIDHQTDNTSNITVSSCTFTGQAYYNTAGSTFLIDNCTFDNISVGPSAPEGRLQLAAGSGFVVTNCHFGGPGESDGIQIGSSGGVTIGPGNVFDGLIQGSYSRHIDAIQQYAPPNVTITGNFFINNTIDIGIYDGGGNETITNNVFGPPHDAVQNLQLGGIQGMIMNHNTFRNTTLAYGTKAGNTPNNNWTVTNNLLVNNSAIIKGGDQPGRSSGCSFSYNMKDATSSIDPAGSNDITGSPTFVGGSNPTTYAGYQLTTSSLGYHSASDGKDRGVDYGTGGDTQAPSVPTGLSSSSITQTSFTLSWTASTDNVGVTGYEVFKNGASIGTSATASMSVTGLTASTTYSMTVRARDAVPNWSAQSTALNVTTQTASDTQAPSVPTGLTSSSITQTSFTLSWTASTDNVGVTGYEVFKNGASIGTSATTSMSVTGLTANTSYSMTVRARDAVPNWSAQSAALNVTTLASGAVTSSTTWQSFTVSTQTGTFTAAFDAVPNTANMNGVTGIQNGTATDYPNLACAARFYTTGLIEAINGGDGVYSSSTTVNYSAGTSYHFRLVINVTAHTYSIYVTPNGQGEVTLGTNYAFRSQQAGVTQLTGWSLVAGTGTHTVSNMTFATAGDTQAPSVPTGLTSSSITQTSFTLNWTASTDNVGVTGYEVFKNGASIGTSASASMSVTGLTASTTYSMTVRARDAVPNWSAQSTALIVTTASAGDTQAPSVPTGLTSSSIAQTSFTLNWTASTDNVGVTGYEVFKNGASIGTSASASMSVTGLTASTTYSMTVRARDAVPNWSAQSTALKVMTASASVTSSTTWQSFTRSTQTGTFTAAFDAVPNTANMNGVTGIQNGTATNYPNLACAVRFYTAGKIEAINGGDGVYSSSTTVNYSAGTSYHFRLVINVTAHTYSIYVTPNGQGEVTLGTNYAFRSQQAGVTQLTGWSLVALTGTHTVSNMTFGTSGKISQAENNESETGNNADVMPSKPVTFSLSQNYPNPFNPTTNIEYRIANTGFVSLKIYDVLGREVSTLVNGQKSIGIYTVQWDASNLPSGVYFSRLTVQTQEGMPIVMTKKILFTK